LLQIKYSCQAQLAEFPIGGHSATLRETVQQHLIETRSDVESQIQEYPRVIPQCIIELR